MVEVAARSSRAEPFTQTGDGQALKISDFVDEEAYHKLAVYAGIYQATGAEDQLGFGVRVESRFVLGYALDRAERSFTERDRVLLNLIRPHIVQTYLHLEELAGHDELKRGLEAALRENGLGVIVVNEARERVHATPGAVERLASYLPIPADSRRLPDQLARWAFAKNGDGGAPFVVAGHSGRLLVRRAEQASRVILLLSEETAAAAARNLAPFKLTPRELEVLPWLAQGKSNAEIAALMQIGTSTVKRHVARVLEKLGVESRTAAALVWRSVGSPAAD